MQISANDIHEVEFQQLRKIVKEYGPRIVVNAVSTILTEMVVNREVVKDGNGNPIDGSDVINAAANLADMQLY
jgi:hypothetical protein